MKALVFVPHGLMQKESGLVALVVNYLTRVGAEVFQMQCNGAAGVCGRDAAATWNRPLTACLKCHHEQRQLGKWMGARAREIGALLSPDDVAQSRNWIMGLAREELLRAEFRGTNIYQICEATFTGRFGKSSPTFSDEAEEPFLRQLLLAAVQTSAAADTWLASVNPDVALVSGLGDVLEEAVLSRLAARDIDHAVFRYEPEEQTTAVIYPKTKRTYATKLVFDNIKRMRGDHRTWPPEISSVVHEILGFLGYGEDRVPAGSSV
jgi:hypothetical protein